MTPFIQSVISTLCSYNDRHNAKHFHALASKITLEQLIQLSK